VLPAFAAAFFGAIQFKGGRFNVWGTWLAVIVLGTGVAGLELLQAGFWATDVFNGAVLIVAVGLSVRQRRMGRRIRRRR
jgi:ribose transport system permease protein